jgi:hypothetical protein
MNEENKLYTEDEMITEVCDVIEAMGGSVDIINKEKHFFKITIDPQLEEDAYLVIEEIINEYSIKSVLAQKNNPFIRPAQMAKEIYGKDK